MGKQVVIQITCDRCTRVEHRPLSDAQPPDDKKKPDFVGLYMGERVEFQDLCTPCQEIVGGHWRQIVKSLTKSSPQRPKK